MQIESTTQHLHVLVSPSALTSFNGMPPNAGKAMRGISTKPNTACIMDTPVAR